MTEEEIVDVLKANLEEGVAFHFLADEIQDWVKKHIHKVVIFNGTDGNKAEHWVNVINRIAPLTEHSVVALRDDYKLKGGKWVDFDIDEEGFFKVSNRYNTSIPFRWFEWREVLKKFPELTNFGGYMYGKGTWSLYPRVLNTAPSVIFISSSDNHITSSYYDENSKLMKPAIPKKIRFWMEGEKKE